MSSFRRTDIDADIGRAEFDELSENWLCEVDDAFKAKMLEAGISERYFGVYPEQGMDI